MNELDLNKIVEIKQMPIVFEELEKIGAFIEEQTKDLDKLECTEENKQEVKNRRTEINNTLKVLEDKRKEIKNKLLEPYNVFNTKYEEECKSKLEDASNLLKDKIETIEDAQREERQNELMEFFKQHIDAMHLEEIIKPTDLYTSTKINFTLSASMKSLKEQILAFLERVSDEVDTILLEDYKDEILFEYKHNGFDYAKAKSTILTRKKEIEEIKKRQEEREKQKEQDEIIIERVEELVSPKPIYEDVEELEVSFTIKTTKDKILKLKEWLNEQEIEYK